MGLGLAISTLNGQSIQTSLASFSDWSLRCILHWR
jgi:hypothetical protein